MALRPKYSSIGLRRDRNLSDVDDPYESLKNLLNDLVPSDEESFTPDDLKAIEGLRNERVTTENLEELIGQTTEYTDINRAVRPITPFVTLKDNVENAKVFTGDPPFLRGGDGINAKFYPSFAVRSQAEIKARGDSATQLTGDYLISQPLAATEEFNFWDQGIFQFNDKIFDTFQDSFGLVQWEGYMALSARTNSHLYAAIGTGLFLIEIDYNDDNNWTMLTSIYDEIREVSIGDISITTDGLSVTFTDTNDLSSISSRDTITHINGVPVDGEPLVIDEVSATYGTILLSRDASGILSSNITLRLQNTIGSDESSLVTRYRVADSFYSDKLHIRMTLWWPEPADPNIIDYANKYFAISYSTVSTYIPYYFFYTENPAFRADPNPLSIEYFYKRKLDPWNRESSASFTVDNSILIDYDPPVVASDRFKGIATSGSGMRYAGKGKYANDISLFSGLERGDYFVRNNEYVQISDVLNANLFEAWFERVDDLPAAMRGEGVAENYLEGGVFFGYKGIVGIYDITRFSASNPVVNAKLEGSSVEDIQVNHIVIADDASLPTYRVASVSLGSGVATIELSPLYDEGPAVSSTPFPQNTGRTLAIYRDKGLEDRSKDVFCQGVFGKRVSVDAANGQNQITLDDVNNIAIGSYVQFAGPIPSGTTVSSISGNTITLTNNILAIIPLGSTVTISPDNTNREICVVALDTAPPFVGTATGLETNTATGNAGIDANTLSIKELKVDLNAGEAVQLGAGNNYTETLSVTSGGKTYKLLID